MVAKFVLALLPLIALAQANVAANYKAFPRTTEENAINAYDKRLVDTCVDETANSNSRDTGKEWNDKTLKEQGNKKGAAFTTDDTKYYVLPDDGCGNGGGSLYGNSKTGKNFNEENTNKFESTNAGKVYDNYAESGNARNALQKEQEYRGYGYDHKLEHGKDVYPVAGHYYGAGYGGYPYGYGKVPYGYGKVPYGYGKYPYAYGKYPVVDSCEVPKVDACYL